MILPLSLPASLPPLFPTSLLPCFHLFLPLSVSVCLSLFAFLFDALLTFLAFFLLSLAIYSLSVVSLYCYPSQRPSLEFRLLFLPQILPVAFCSSPFLPPSPHFILPVFFPLSSSLSPSFLSLFLLVSFSFLLLFLFLLSPTLTSFFLHLFLYFYPSISTLLSFPPIPRSFFIPLLVPPFLPYFFSVYPRKSNVLFPLPLPLL